MVDAAILVGLFFPLIGFLLLMITSNVINRGLTNFVGCMTIFISFVCFVSLLFIYNTTGLDSQTLKLYSWIPVTGINADFSLYLDQLSLLMTLIITGIGFLIHVYSIGYMDHDTDFARYFAFLNFFVFSMLLLVLGNHLLVLFVGWEGVGLASYLLIGFWYEKPAAAQAATKAFVVNRIGDLGLLLGILLAFYTFGTGVISEISMRVGNEFSSGAPILTLMTLLFFIGATGKSAQIPLQTWLPDAMAGPTPVSALIHAATMVTAGVYLIVRLHAVFLLAPLTMQVVSIIGGATALYAALCALGQTDLKRVLAYSTVSQLGYMFMACGVGAFYAAMFHLTTHAFVKALLFLSAGNVVHMMHGTTEMGEMGGLSKRFPKTHWMFLIGVLALSGVPPLAVFFSKDLILEEEHLLGFNALFAVGLLTAILTAFYLTRAYCLTFMGYPKMDAEGLKDIKEAPSVMLVPVAVLALLALFGGILGFGFGRRPILESFLKEADITLPIEPAHGWGVLTSFEAIVSIIGVLLGIMSAAIAYTKYEQRWGKNFTVLKHAFYVDEIYEWLFVKPLQTISRLIAQFVEPFLFDGSIRVVADSAGDTSRFLQRFQSGQLRSYAAWMVLGTVLFIVFFVS